MNDSSNARTPLLISAALVGAGLVIALLSGLTHGSLLGGVVAAAGAIPSAYAAWAGMQKETQTSLAAALGMLFASLGIGALLIILWVIDWIRG